MVSMDVTRYFDAKIVNYQGEGGGSPCMIPKAGRELSRIVSSCAGTFLKEVVGELASDWNPIHIFADFYADPSIVDDFVQVIFVNNFLRNDLDRHPHVLWSFMGVPK